MAALQVLCARLDAGSATSTQYMGISADAPGANNWTTTVPSTGGSLIRWTGEYKNFTFRHVTVPGSGKSFTYTLVKNGVDTSIVVTVANLVDTGRSTDSVSVVPGDTLYWRRVPSGTPTNSSVVYAVELSHATDYVTGYTGLGLTDSANTIFTPGLTPQFGSVLTAGSQNSIIAAPGALTELSYKLGTAPGSGKSYLLTLIKNGVDQDGAGGTPDTRVTIQNSGTTGSWTGSIALVGSDYLTLKCAPSTTPTASTITAAVKILSTVDGESNFCGNPLQVLGSTTRYYEPGQRFSDHSATETDVTVDGSVTPFALRGCRVRLSAALDASADITFTTRRNGTTPAGTPTVHMTGSQQTGYDATGTITVTGVHTVDFRYIPTVIPIGSLVPSWAWIQYAVDVAGPPDVPVTTIAGVLTPIKRHTLTISEVTNGRNTLSCDVISTDASYRPTVDSEVVVYLNGDRIFGGRIDSTHEYGITGGYGAGIFTRVAVNDFNSLADRRYVKETLASGSLKSMLTTLVANYLDDYGVELDVSQVTGPTLDAVTYDYRQLTEVFNDLATLASGATATGWIWEIDYDKTLRMYEGDSLPAPFNIVNNDGNAIGDITVDQGSRTGYANRIILRYGSPQLLDWTDTFTGDGTQIAFQLTYTPADGTYATYRSLIISNNGVTEPVQVGGPPVWTYTDGPPTVTRSTAPAAGNTILVRYFVQFPQTIIAEDTGEQIAPVFVVEKIIEKPDVFDAALAQSIADAELAIALERPTTVRYQTRMTGLKPGQTQTITASARNVNDDYLINDIQSRDSGDKEGTLIRNVTATQGSTLKPTWRAVYKKWGTSGGPTASVG